MPTLTTIIPLGRETIDRPATADAPCWLDVASSWPVLDRTGTIVGYTERVRGHRSTGERGPAHATLHVPAEKVGSIARDESRLTVTRDELVEP